MIKREAEWELILYSVQLFVIDIVLFAENKHFFSVVKYFYDKTTKLGRIV